MVGEEDASFVNRFSWPNGTKFGSGIFVTKICSDIANSRRLPFILKTRKYANVFFRLWQTFFPSNIGWRETRQRLINGHFFLRLISLLGLSLLNRFMMKKKTFFIGYLHSKWFCISQTRIHSSIKKDEQEHKQKEQTLCGYTFTIAALFLFQFDACCLLLSFISFQFIRFFRNIFVLWAMISIAIG